MRGRSGRVVDAVAPVPVFLAGGLNPGNVAEAIAAVGEFGVDVCSGVRSGGMAAAAKLQGLIALIPH